MKTRIDEMCKIKSIGNVSELKTRNKDNVVDAINEIQMDSNLGCRDYDGSSGVNVPPIPGFGCGTGITPVGLQFRWEGSKLGVKRENEYSYVFSDIIGPEGRPGRDGAPGRVGDRGRKGDPGFPSKKDWKTLLERVKAIESLNNVKPVYENAEMSFIANLSTSSDRIANINYGVFSTMSTLTHELSMDGGTSFKTVEATSDNGFYTISESFANSNVGDEVECVVRTVTVDGSYIYSNLFTITVSDSDSNEPIDLDVSSVSYGIINNENLIIKFNSNKNITKALLSVNGGPYAHKGIIEGDRLIFIIGRLETGLYSCRLKLNILENNNDSEEVETVALDVYITNSGDTLPSADAMEIMSLNVKKYINENGKVDKRALTIRFKVKDSVISEARYFYYSVDTSSLSPLNNVTYIGNGIFETRISWVFDPYVNRRLEIMCSRLNKLSTTNNVASLITEFAQDYNGDIVIPETEGQEG